MIDREKLQDVLAAYKRDFDAFQWKNEKYKWTAVKWFQDHWDINAPDFADMLARSLAKTSNLLSSFSNYPAGMIKGFAQSAPEEVRAMFIALFDESRDVYERIEAFKAQAAGMLEKYGRGAKQHFQHENAISIYLWLRYPDKYYIFKLNEVKKAAAALDSSCQFKKGAYEENIRSFYRLYDEICAELQKDGELKALLQSHLTDACWPDPALRTLTIDVGFYISRFYSESQQQAAEEADDESSGMDPALFSEDWYPSMEEYTPGISKEQWLELLRNKEIIDIDTEYGDSVWGVALAAFYEAGGAATCTQIAERYHVPTARIIGNCTQLAKRIHRETQCPLLDEENAKYWPILFQGKSAGPDVEGGYIWKLRPELFEALTEFDIMRYRWKTEGEEPDAAADTYTKDDFLKEVFLSEERYDALSALLKNKKNVILQGAPGVGKTFAARRLAWSMMGRKDDSRIELVQFHQNYSYEDFMMGYRPAGDGFELKYGIFYRFCQKAASQPDKEHFFIIDEINRGNMSRIFGELLMLIERDYRDTKITLAYNGQPFFVPENLCIIGMMNTADRSLAMIDYALRRRFSFFDMEPGFDSDGFIRYQQKLNNDTFNDLVAKVRELNRAIAADKSLGRGFCIGHSYFCNQDTCTEQWLRSVVEYDILPMLREYWFDEPATLLRWENELRGVFQ